MKSPSSSNPRKRLWRYCFITSLFTVILSISPVFANDDWDDLYEGTKKIYGSEKETKYDVNAFFWERENWENHYSNQVFGLYKHTNYPKYLSTYFFPFYSSLQSKIDNRKKFRVLNYMYKQKNSEVERFFFPFVYSYSDSSTNSETLGVFPFFYNSTDGSNQNFKSSIFVSPLYFSKLTWYESKELKVPVYSRLSFSPIHYSYENRNGDSIEKTRFFPIIPLFYHHSSSNYTHTNLLMLFGKTTSGDSLKNLYAIPFFFLDRSDDGYLHIPILLIFNTWNKQKESYYRSFLLFYFAFGDKFENTYAGPFYYLNYTKDTETKWILNYYSSNNFKTGESSFHFFPFYSSSRNADQTTDRNILYFQRWSNDKENKLESFYTLPFLYYKKNSYFVFAPFYFSFSETTENSEENTYAGPFYYLNYTKDTETKWILNYYSSNNFKTGESSFHFFPFYSSSRNGDETADRNILYFQRWSKDKDNQLESFYTLPFLYYKKNSYFVFAPFYFSFSGDTEDTEEKTIAGPLYYYHRTKDSETKWTLNFYSSNDYKTGESTFRFFPFYSSSYSADQGYDRNLLYLHRWKNDKEGNLESFYTLPFLFYKKNSYFIFAPFYFSFSDRTKNSEENSYAGPLFYLNYTKDTKTKWILNYYSFNDYRTGESTFRFFPFYSSSYSAEEGYDRNLLYLHRWKNDKEGNFESFHTLPFLFYKKNSYFVFAPFYFSFSDTTEDSEENTYAGPLYYLNYTKDKEVKWIFNYFSTDDYKNGNSSLTIFPFYHSHESEEDKKYISFSPVHYTRKSEEGIKKWALLYYSHENFTNQTNFHTVFPLIYGWKNSENEGDIFIPFYLNYKEGNKSIHLNIAGFSIARQVGTLSANASLGRNRNKTYADFELIAFYNLFSFSTRKSFELPSYFSSGNTSRNNAASIVNADPPEIKSEETVETPKIVKEKSVSREKSENFWGWSALFGIAAYERADTKRHIRVLPLGCWFSWDQKSDDKVYFIPPFNLWYVSDDLEYKVLFPLYAKQRTGKSFIESYLTFFYIREYEEKTGKSEHSILWPLSNFYTSDDNGGSRVIPFYWYKRTTSDGISTKRSFSVLHYYKSEDSISKSDWFLSIPSFIPWFFISGTKEKNSQASKSWFFPVYYSQNSEAESVTEKTNLSLIHYFESTKTKESENWHLRFPSFLPWISITSNVTPTSTESKWWFIPVYLSYKSTKEYERERINLTLLHYYESKTTKNLNDWHIHFPSFFPIVSISKNSNENFHESKWWFFPVYYSKNTKSDSSEEYTSLSIFHYYESNKLKDSENRHLRFPSFLPWISFSNSKNPTSTESKWWFFPVYYSKNTKSDSADEYTNLSIFHYYESNKLKDSENRHLRFPSFLPWISFSNSKSPTSTESKWWFFPVYYSKNTKSDSADEYSNLSIFHYYESNKFKDSRNSYLWFPGIFPVIYVSTIEGKISKESKWWIIPLFYSRNSKSNLAESTKNFSPLHYFSSWKSSDSLHWYFRVPGFLPWISFEKTKNIRENEFKWWIFPAFYYKNSRNSDELSLTLLSPVFYYNTSNFQSKNKITNSSTLWLLLYFHDYYESVSPIAHKSSATLTPLFYISDFKGSAREESFSWIFPFFFHEYSSRKDAESDEYYSIFYYRQKSYTNSSKTNWESKSFWLLPYYQSFFTESTAAFDRKKEVVTVFPFNYFIHEKTEGKSTAQTKTHDALYRETYQITNLLFHYSETSYKKDNSSYSKTFFFPIIPLFYRSVTENESHYNLFWFIDWKTDREAKDFRLFLLGFYLYSSEEYSRQNFLYFVFDHQYHRSTDTDQLKLFLGLMHFESSPRHSKFNALFGVLAGYESRDDGYYDINFLWLRYLNNKEEHIKLNLIPFFYHDRTATENVYVIPPLLSYSMENEDRLLQLGGLGLLWYRNYDKRKEEETKAVLLGSIYYEIRLKERGYKSRGSLWGVLWEYQTESVNDYSKLSIFKFIYSNTTVNGQTYSRIFGVKF